MKRIISMHHVLTCLLISIFLVSSCASRKHKEKVQQDQFEQKHDLELDKEVEDKFKIQEVNSKEIEEKQSRHSGSSRSDLAREPGLEPRSKNKESKLIKIHQAKHNHTISTDIKPMSPNRVDYPEQFPQKYKDYDKKFQKSWESFDSSYLQVGEKINMQVSYLGLGMGSMELETRADVLVGRKQAFSFAARLQTASFYSYIYELDDSLSAHVEKNEFLPLKYELIQRETKKEIDDIQLFDHDKRMLYYRYRKWRKDKKRLTKRKEDIFIPKYAIDPFSLLYFVRGLPLKTGKDFSFPVVTRDKLWVVKLVVGKVETIKTINGKKEVYKVTAKIGEEGSFIKKGAIELWFDTAPGHILWKLRVGTKIGSLYAKVKELIRR